MDDTTLDKPVGGARGSFWWALVSLIMSGGVLAAVSAFLPRWPTAPSRPWWFPLLSGLVALSLVLFGMALGPGRAERGVGWVRKSSTVAAAVVLVPTVWCWGDAGENLDSAVPMPGPLLCAVGFTAVFVGTALMAVVGPKGAATRRGHRPVFVGVVAGVLVVSSAVTAAVAVTRYGPVDATTVSAVKSAPVPTAPREQTWVWHVPDGMDAVDVRPAGVGVVVGVGDGVIALDGVTGGERWHYRVTGATRDGLEVSPDGGVVVVTFSTEDSRTGAGPGEGTTEVRVVVLDAVTGEVILGRTGEVDGHGVSGLTDLMESPPVPTDHVLVGRNAQDTEVRGFDLRTGERRWRYRMPDGCLLMPGHPNPRLNDDVVVVAMMCNPDDDPANPHDNPRTEGPATFTVVGLDDRTGRQRWRFNRAEAEFFSREFSTDGSLTLLRWWVPDPGRDRTGVVLDTTTGAEVFAENDIGPGGAFGQFIDGTPDWLVHQNRRGAFNYSLTTTGSRSVDVPIPPGLDRSRMSAILVNDESVMALFVHMDTFEVALSVRLWDGSPGWPVALSLPVHQHDDRPIEYQMVAAPGAVVVHSSASNDIVGLA